MSTHEKHWCMWVCMCACSADGEHPADVSLLYRWGGRDDAVLEHLVDFWSLFLVAENPWSNRHRIREKFRISLLWDIERFVESHDQSVGSPLRLEPSRELLYISHDSRRDEIIIDIGRNTPCMLVFTSSINLINRLIMKHLSTEMSRLGNNRRFLRRESNNSSIDLGSNRMMSSTLFLSLFVCSLTSHLYVLLVYRSGPRESSRPVICEEEMPTNRPSPWCTHSAKGNPSSYSNLSPLAKHDHIQEICLTLTKRTDFWYY